MEQLNRILSLVSALPMLPTATWACKTKHRPKIFPAQGPLQQAKSYRKKAKLLSLAFKVCSGPSLLHPFHCLFYPSRNRNSRRIRWLGHDICHAFIPAYAKVMTSFSSFKPLLIWYLPWETFLGCSHSHSKAASCPLWSSTVLYASSNMDSILLTCLFSRLVFFIFSSLSLVP